MGSVLSRYEARKDRQRAQFEKQKALRRAEHLELGARRTKSRRIRKSVQEINEERRREWKAHREQRELDAAKAANSNPEQRSRRILTV
ncbi:hypothetical protein MMC29_007816 [Sticta canariensis]|nr:hypothetical protein [Sticta canariensis]